MINLTGTPFVGYVSLTNGAPGPVPFALFTVMGAAAYTLGASERVYITNISLSSDDTVATLVTVDTGGATPTRLTSSYLNNVLPPTVESIPPGLCRGVFGTVPRATAPAISAAKTVECLIKGYISKT